MPSSITATAPARNRLVLIIRRRLSHLSVKTPATGPSSSSGRYWAASVRPGSRRDAAGRQDGAGLGRISRHEPRALAVLAIHTARQNPILRAERTHARRPLTI